MATKKEMREAIFGKLKSMFIKGEKPPKDVEDKIKSDPKLKKLYAKLEKSQKELESPAKMVIWSKINNLKIIKSLKSNHLYRTCVRIDEFKNSQGDLLRRQANPLIKMKNDALNNSLKLATQFGLTPVARASISAPVTNNNTQINNYFD